MNKKRVFKITLRIAIVGFAAWAIIPLFIDKEVSESAPEQATILTTQADNDVDSSDQTSALAPEEAQQNQAPRERIGSLEGRNNYSAKGTVKLIEDESGNRFVRFDEDLIVDNGPDLIVYIGTAEDRGTSLGALKGNIGSQNYEIPSDVDVDTIDTIRIFCRAFNVDFAITTL